MFGSNTIRISLRESMTGDQLVKQIVPLLEQQDSIDYVAVLSEEDVYIVHFSKNRDRPTWADKGSISNFIWENFGYKRDYAGRIVIDPSREYNEVALEAAHLKRSKLDINYYNFVREGADKLASSRFVKMFGVPFTLSEDQLEHAKNLAQNVARGLEYIH